VGMNYGIRILYPLQICLLITIYKNMKITDKNELTPVQEIGEILFKREDFFQPFENSNINGGKVRQCLEILEINKSLIASSYNSTVATHTSVRSPQGLIVAKCANHFDFDSVTGIASVNPQASAKKHKLLRLTGEISDIRKIAGTGQNTKTLDRRLNEVQDKEGFFIVNFGMNANEAKLPVMLQCENLTDEIDYLIVPSGSCITLAAIAEGVQYFKKKIKRVIGVQVHGYDRNKEVKGFTSADYELVVDSTYKEKDWTLLKNYNYKGIELDAMYEARAFEWLKKRSSIDFKTNKILFWIVGNINEYRF
jgi:1-aminocyclopropane-1-carboxylate deaminase/D-cysteine desulfhydrase-like pyridoxal-dependent ACC family enzyme